MIIIKTQKDIFNWLEYIQEKIVCYEEYLNKTNNKKIISYMFDDIEADLKRLYDDKGIKVYGALSENNTTNIIDFTNDLEWLYKIIDNRKYEYFGGEE